MDPDHDRQHLWVSSFIWFGQCVLISETCGILVRDMDSQVQAVLVTAAIQSSQYQLRTDSQVLVSFVQWCAPVQRGAGRQEPSGSYWWCGVRDSLNQIITVVVIQKVIK